MRFYGFGNYYLSSLQQGLQSAHTVAELFVKYRDYSEYQSKLYDWASNHKTMVLLNGGNSGSLSMIYDNFNVLSEQGMDLPFSKFNEDDISLNNALTYVGIIVPERIYKVSSEVRNIRNIEALQIFDFYKFQPWEKELVFILNSYGLAH